MVQIEQLEYIKIANKFNGKPFNLTSAWSDYEKSKGNEILYFVDSTSQPQILCWARIKTIKFIGQVLDLEGPLYKEEISYKQICKFLEEIKALPYKGVFINLNTPYDTKFELSARRSMFKRPIGQSNTTLTMVVPIMDFNPDNNWKRNLKKAKNSNFKFEVKNNTSLDDCKIIESLHTENAKIKKLGYMLKAEQIEHLTNGEGIYTCFLNDNEKPIEARIISIDNQEAHDIFACNSLDSRKNGATQYIMQMIFEYLKDNKVKFFDFSRIPVGKENAKGVYEFKNSTRGNVIQYNGEWVWFKNKKLRHLYYFYNALINKKDFY